MAAAIRVRFWAEHAGQGQPNRGRANTAPKFVVRSPAQGLRVINHPDIAGNFDKALRRKPKHKIAVLVPCAQTKPFPDAPSHKSGYLQGLAGKKVDKHVVSEPLGVVPYEWSRTYPNDSYDFPPEYLTGAAFDALSKRIGKWFSVVGPKYSKIYLALPRHHAKLVKAAMGGKTPKNVTWVGQRQCLDDGVCKTGEYRATTHSYRGFLKDRVRGAANRAPLSDRIEAVRDELARAAQGELDGWDWSDGGACDAVADALHSVLAEAGIDATGGGHEGDDHAWLIAYDDASRQACGVDVPARVYEVGGGYSWTPIDGASVGPSDVEIWAMQWHADLSTEW